MVLETLILAPRFRASRSLLRTSTTVLIRGGIQALIISFIRRRGLYLPRFSQGEEDMECTAVRVAAKVPLIYKFDVWENFYSWSNNRHHGAPGYRGLPWVSRPALSYIYEFRTLV